LFWEHPYFIFKNKFTQFILYYQQQVLLTLEKN